MLIKKKGKFPYTAVRHAHAAYQNTKKDKALLVLVNTVANLLGWHVDEGRKNKVNELLWECGLVRNKRKLGLKTFLHYCKLMATQGCIPLCERK